jgi:hypothetical protein
MGLSVDFFLTGFDEAVTLVIADASREAIEQGFEELRAQEAQAFSDGGWPGEPWPPRLHNVPWPLLVHTGRLRASLTDPAAPGHVEQILAGPEGQVTGIFGTTVHYAHFIHGGTRYMPARPLLPERLSAT